MYKIPHEKMCWFFSYFSAAAALVGSCCCCCDDVVVVACCLGDAPGVRGDPGPQVCTLLRDGAGDGGTLHLALELKLIQHSNLEPPGKRKSAFEFHFVSVRTIEFARPNRLRKANCRHSTVRRYPTVCNRPRAGIENEEAFAPMRGPR